MINFDALGAVVAGSWLWLIDSSPLLGVLVAILSASIALHAIGQAAKDSDHRTRPVVVAEFQQAKESDASLELVIKNYGLSLAKNLKIEFDRPITAELTDERIAGGLAIQNRYVGRVFAVLSPHQEFRNTWWLGTSRRGFDHLVNNYDTPDEIGISVSYEDLKGKRYSDAFVLEVDSFLFATGSVSSTSVRGRLGLISESMRKISDSSSRIASAAEDSAERSFVAPADRTVVNMPSSMTSGSVPQIPIFPGTKPSLPGSSDRGEAK